MARRVSSEKLIGRSAELAVIDTLLAGLGESGHPATAQCLLVGGEAGVGKTRLLTELARMARARGYGVAMGACVENGAEILPLNAVVQLLESLAVSGFTSAVPIPAGVADQGAGVEPARLFQAVTKVLADAAATRPVVAIFEDLHWADESTRDLLGVLVPRVSTERVLLVGTYRTDELTDRHALLPLLARIERSVPAERIGLGPLSRAEIGALAAEILGAAPGAADLDALYARGSGSPFFTEELLIDGLGSDTIPDSLRQVVLARCRSLADGAAATTLDAAALLSPPIDDVVLRGTAGLSVADYEAALDALAEKGLLVGDTHARNFRHELVREVIARELPPGRRSRLHRRAADALAAFQPQRAGEVARHRLASADQPGALESLVEAGRAALAMGAAAEAAGHLGRALELWDRVPDAAARAGLSRGAHLRMAATAALRSRRVDRAVELGHLAAVALEQDGSAVGGEAWYELSVYRWNAAVPGVLAALDRARTLTATDPPSALSAHIDHDLSYHATMRGDHAAAAQLARRALETARLAGSPGVVAAVMSSLAERRAERGDPSGVDELKAAIDAARDEDDITDVAKAVANLTYCLAQLGREEETPPIFQSWIDRIVGHGLDGTAGLFLRVNTLDAYEAIGEWDKVQQLVDEMFARYDDASLRRTSAGLATNWGQVLVGRGEYELASSLFLRGHEEFQSGYYKGSWGGLLSGLVELGSRGVIPPVGDDEIETMLGHALPGEAVSSARAVATACRFRVDRHSGPAAIATAQGWLTTVAWAVDEHWVTTPPALANWLDQARAELAAAAGQLPEPSWGTIAQRWRQLGRPYPEAYATYRQADAELRAGTGRSRATKQAVTVWLRRAHEIAESLGAAPLLADVADLARRARLDLAATGPQEPAPPAPFGLTDREVEVLRLVAEGRTDREIAAELFISRKTASLHVSRILRKVQATNRFEAAAIAGDVPTRRSRGHQRGAGDR
jgi:DNA-binding CsgD family transcriptional regulator/tetratricopeptide (TPR) repeat protein